jgi:hypothetical protein
MDEGRNMCLIFPQLIEIEGSSQEQREKRAVFNPKYVRCAVYGVLLLHELRLMILLDVIYFTTHA